MDVKEEYNFFSAHVVESRKVQLSHRNLPLLCSWIFLLFLFLFLWDFHFGSNSCRLVSYSQVSEVPCPFISALLPSPPTPPSLPPFGTPWSPFRFVQIDRLALTSGCDVHYSVHSYDGVFDTDTHAYNVLQLEAVTCDTHNAHTR